MLAALEQNALRPVNTTAKRNAIPAESTLSSIEGPSGRYAPKQGAPQAPAIGRMVDIEAKRAEGKGIGYEKWAKVYNLKQMAATVAAMEQYGYSPEGLDEALVSANADLQSSAAELKAAEAALREKKDLQKQVLAYSKTRNVRQGLKAQKTDKARKTYRERHESDFIIADAAARYFREHGIKKPPAYKALQAEIERLTAGKNARYNDYRTKKERVRELQTMKNNLSQMRRGEPGRQKKQEQER